MYVAVFLSQWLRNFGMILKQIRKAATASAPQNYGVEHRNERLVRGNAHGAFQRCGRLLGAGVFESCYSFELPNPSLAIS